MRKLLLGATALTAVAAIQTANAAEIADGLTIGATVRVDMLLAGEHEETTVAGGTETTTSTDSKFAFRDKTTSIVFGYTKQTENGYTLKVHLEALSSSDAGRAADDFGEADEASFTVTASDVSVLFGRDDGAVSATAIYIPETGSGMLDGSAQGIIGSGIYIPVRIGNSGDATKAMVTYSTNSLTIAGSYAPTMGETSVDYNDNEDARGDNFVELGVNYSHQVSGMDLGVSANYVMATGGQSSDGTTVTEYDDLSGFAIAGQIKTMGITGAAHYMNNGSSLSEKDTVDSDSAYWIGVSYELPGVIMGNDLKLAANYGARTIEYKTSGLENQEDTTMIFGLGTTLVAGVGASFEYVTYGSEGVEGQKGAETTGNAMMARLTAGF